MKQNISVSKYSAKLLEKIEKLVKKELERLKRLNEIKFYEKEKPTLLKGSKQGSYDFYAETPEGKKIGIEILTRPSKNKLLAKLQYLKNVDIYIFVFPEGSLKPYRKGNLKFSLTKKHKYFPMEFKNKKLHVWIISLESKKIIFKDLFSNLFYCK